MLVDLKTQALTHNVVKLFAHCLVDTHPETLQAIADYYDHKEALHLKGFVEAEHLVGIVGYAYKDPHKILMTHLAVDPEFRGKGVATSMLSALVESEQIKWIGVEATETGVSFYKKLHFVCVPNGNRENGEIYYSCEWKRSVSKPF